MFGYNVVVSILGLTICIVFEKVTSNYISNCKYSFYIGLKISVCYNVPLSIFTPVLSRSSVSEFGTLPAAISS
jgi:hypothetical protein